MHPILARGGPLALYLGVWVLVGGLLATLLVGQGGLQWSESIAVALPLATTYAFVCLSAWYVSRSMPLVSTTAVRIVATGLTASAISSAGWVVVARVWTGFLAGRGWIPATAGGSALATSVFAFGTLLYLQSLAVSYLLAAFETSREADRRALEGQVLAREAELRSLRAQIDPHFLFNSLHSISALTTADPAAARRMCLLLAEFLRESLALGAHDRITLERELGLVERFLAVERVRYGPRLSVDIGAAGDAGRCLVPPLLLQPVVENAVTHGVAHVLEGGTIRISAGLTSGGLSIVVESPCDPERPRGKGTGVGLANVRARLRALHGVEARVTARDEGRLWRTEVSLPAVTET